MINTTKSYYSADDVKKLMYWASKMTIGCLGSGISEFEIGNNIERKINDTQPLNSDHIWNLVHTWCNEQSAEIPDWNKRVLMERIFHLLDAE